MPLLLSPSFSLTFSCFSSIAFHSLFFVNKKINQCTEKSSLNNHTPTKYIAVHFAVAITANAVLACVFWILGGLVQFGAVSKPAKSSTLNAKAAELESVAAIAKFSRDFSNIAVDMASTDG